MNYFTVVNKWILPAQAFMHSMAEMAIDGKEGNEGVALWLGTHAGDVASISHVVVLRGPGVTRRPQLLVMDDSVLNAITDVCIQMKLVLVGQIHSHGPQGWVELSRTDKTEGIRSPFYLSAVAPYYAQREGIRPTDCGFHVCDINSQFHRLGPADVETRIVISHSSAERVEVHT